jgi:hypothetical protein
MDNEYFDDGSNEYYDNEDSYQEGSVDEFDYDQIAQLLIEQKYEIGTILQALQAIANSLPRELVDAEQQKQLLIIQQLLVKLYSNIEQNSKLGAESSRSLQSINDILKELQQGNEESQKQYSRLKKQLDQQKKNLDDRFSPKFIAFQCLAIAFLSSFTTVLALKTFPSTSELSSPTNTELPKASPSRSGNKSKSRGFEHDA